jgi:hypothetical protein
MSTLSGSGATPPRLPFSLPVCAGCGQHMYLSRVVPHERYDHVDVRSFACDCGAQTEETVPRLE